MTRRNMEACVYAAARCTPAMLVFFLITKDYKFFRTLVRSPAVERLLRHTTLGILGISEGVVVKLAGKVISHACKHCVNIVFLFV